MLDALTVAYEGQSGLDALLRGRWWPVAVRSGV